MAFDISSRPATLPCFIRRSMVLNPDFLSP
jgi:hypothetical protein